MTTASRPLTPPRLAVVLTHATQYYSPWFRNIAQNAAITLRVFYLSEFGLKPAFDEKFTQSFAWDIDLTSGYDFQVVPNTAKSPDTLRRDGIQNPDLTRRLAAWKPDAILLFGYNYHTHLRLIPWARVRGIPLIFRGDSHLLGRAKLPVVKRALLAFLYRQFAAVTYVGQANHRYFRSLGVPEERLFFAPHAVDSTHFRQDHPGHRERARAIRNELHLTPDTRVVLYSGKLISSKNPEGLLEAFVRINAADTALIFAGDGPEKSALVARAAQHPDARIHFLPLANQSEMPARYLAADLFVLPSCGVYETWGLAVNEAMHLGVPCLVSDRVGCHLDLITNDETGWTFAADNPESLESTLRHALTELAKNPRRFDAPISHRIEQYSYAAATAGLLRALQSSLPASALAPEGAPSSR